MMFESLGGTTPHLRSHSDKASWHDAMSQLLAIQSTGSVGEVIDHLHKVRKPRLPDVIEKSERELREFNEAAGVELPRRLEELKKFRNIAYSEVKALRNYLVGYSPFETQHGVKGAEFENVLIVVGRGWNQYNFGEMLELASAKVVPPAKEEAFERNRNLFYVACSRPQKRLSILFTQFLSPEALNTLENWFGIDAIKPAP